MRRTPGLDGAAGPAVRAGFDNMSTVIGAFALLFLAVPLFAQGGGWTPLLNGKNLDGWESIGDGLWTVMRDGTLVGQRDLKTAQHQAWLYTTKDFGEYDLTLEYWLRYQSNSGLSIRDQTRARWAHGPNWDRTKTPSHNGYEIQLLGSHSDSYPSGSIYLFVKSGPRLQVDNDWNLLEVQSREDAIRVFVNKRPAAEFAGDPARPKTGPIGLQLHDRNTVVKFRNIRIREISRP
jgi:hypothetical protein